MVLRLAVLLAAAVSAAAQIVEGTIVDSATGAGLAGVKVTLNQEGQVWYTATSDAQGHFLFDHVADGLYADRYSAPGYWWDRDPGPMHQVQMTAGGNPVKLEARMTPLSRLSGRVVDGTGKPVKGATVCALGPRRAACDPADAEGKFDFHEEMVADGYLLLAAPSPNLKPPDPEPGSARLSNWITTWFPGSPTSDGATRIQLTPGAGVADIEVKLLAFPAYPVRGVLLNAEGKPAPHIQVRLSRMFANPTAESQADGSFAFPAVTEGGWMLTAEVEAGQQKFKASAWVEMGDGPREGIALRLAAPFTVHGKRLIELPKGVTLPRRPFLALAPYPTDNVFGVIPPGSPGGWADAQDNFTLYNVYPGQYRIEPPDSPEGYYLDAVRMGETEILSREVAIEAGGPPIVVVYKSNGGTLTGTAENCASGEVVAVPRDPAYQRPGFVRRADCDAHDRYRIGDLRPGDYEVLALIGEAPDILAANPFRSGVPATFADQTKAVTVRAGETTSADLRAVARQ